MGYPYWGICHTKSSKGNNIVSYHFCKLGFSVPNMFAVLPVQGKRMDTRVTGAVPETEEDDRLLPVSLGKTALARPLQAIPYLVCSIQNSSTTFVLIQYYAFFSFKIHFMIHLFLKARLAHLLFTQKDEKCAMSLYTHIRFCSLSNYLWYTLWYMYL